MAAGPVGLVASAAPTPTGGRWTLGGSSHTGGHRAGLVGTATLGRPRFAPPLAAASGAWGGAPAGGRGFFDQARTVPETAVGIGVHRRECLTEG